MKERKKERKKVGKKERKFENREIGIILDETAEGGGGWKVVVVLWVTKVGGCGEEDSEGHK